MATVIIDDKRESPKEFKEAAMSNHVESLIWLTDLPPRILQPTMGNMIKAAAAEHPGKSVLVLCGR
jgi:hypothetical protein